ncbi:MAG: ABC transporter permease [Sphaerochaetaceae bacterium]
METDTGSLEWGRKHHGLRYIKKHKLLYVMLIPGLLVIIIFDFLPYWGLQIAFRDYNIFSGSGPWNAIASSAWVGLKNFKVLFQSPKFYTLLKNTLEINLLRVAFTFPIPIIIALFVVEIKSKGYRKATQTLIYIPYFFSWAVIYGIFSSILASDGLVNVLMRHLTGHTVQFLTSPGLFRGVLVFTDLWKNIGYNSVIYIAVIAAIDPQLYEAARIDGAGKWRQIWNITFLCILPTIVLKFTLSFGHILTTGWSQVLMFYNPAVYDSADIIKTYVYRVGIGNLNFSHATAIDLFNSVIAFILIVTANTLNKKFLHKSIW